MKLKLDKTNMELYQEEILLEKYGEYLDKNKIIDSKDSFESFIVDLLNLGNYEGLIVVIAQKKGSYSLFDWKLKEHHKICLDEGLTVRSYGNHEYAMIKDEEGKYCLFEVSLDTYSEDGGEAWTRIASSKSFDNFKRKVSDVFGGDE